MHMCKTSACAHAAPVESTLTSSTPSCNIILGQTHTTTLHSRFANYAPNTRVLTSQGSWLEIESIIQAFLLPTRTQNLGLHTDHQLTRCEGWSEMSVCFPLATQLPEMHPFSDIQYWLVLILYWYHAYLFCSPLMCGILSECILRGRVNNFTINYLLYIKCLILLVVQSITAKLDIQVLYGKHYLGNKSWYHATENSAESSGWVLQFFRTFHSHGTRATYSILGE